MEEEILSQLATNEETSEIKLPAMETILERVKEGQTIQEAAEIDPQIMEVFYLAAYNNYENGLYKESLQLFSLLCQMNLNEYKYLLGAASSLYELKHYDEAMIAFLFASALNDKDASALFHALDCAMYLEDYTEAQGLALDLISMTKETGQEDLLNKGLLYLDNIEAKLKELK